MIADHRVAVVVPAHDEERLIASTLASMPACVDHVVVVDDGSSDRTRERASAVDDPRIELVAHRINRGVGAAIATGYRVAFGAGADVAVVMGADGQMSPHELESLVLPIVRGEADYVKGDRLSHASLDAMPPVRRVGNAVFSALTRVVTGLSISDSQCGYTALSRSAAARLDLDRMWPRYGYPNDLLARCARAGLRVRDVPVTAIYAGEESGIGLWEGLVVIPSVIVRAAFVRWDVPILPRSRGRIGGSGAAATEPTGGGTSRSMRDTPATEVGVIRPHLASPASGRGTEPNANAESS